MQTSSGRKRYYQFYTCKEQYPGRAARIPVKVEYKYLNTKKPVVSYILSSLCTKRINMKPDFKNINIKNAFQQKNNAKRASENSTKNNWLTPEQIPVKPLYTKEDLEGLEHLDYAAGLPPYLRGPYSTMYVMRPWTIR